MQRIEKSVRVNAPAKQVYEFWRNFENFPSFMEHVESVQVMGDDKRLSHWKLKGPLGMSVEYDAELVKDEPGKMIGWNSTRGSMETTGAVTFADVGDGITEVHVTMQYYDTPGGAVGEAVSRIFQNPEQMLEDDLHRFKDMMETKAGTGASHAMSHGQRL